MPGDRDDPVERGFAHQRLQSLLPRVRERGDSVWFRRAAGPAGSGPGRGHPRIDVGTSLTGARNAREPPRRQAECMRANQHGSNDFRHRCASDAGDRMAYASDPRTGPPGPDGPTGGLRRRPGPPRTDRGRTPASPYTPRSWTVDPASGVSSRSSRPSFSPSSSSSSSRTSSRSPTRCSRTRWSGPWSRGSTCWSTS